MIRKIVLITGVSLALFASSGEELTQKNCASCHMLTPPSPGMMMKNKLKAPPMDAVAFHLQSLKTKQAKIDFIVDYVQYPDIKKAMCNPKRMEKFGLMPSLKGAVSEEDLKKIAEYIVQNHPSKEFLERKKGMMGKMRGMMRGMMGH